jgi:hypothetical protein
MKRAIAIALTAALVSPVLSGAGPAGEERLQPTNLGPGVNTRSDEDDPFVTPDGLLLVYASNAPGTYHLMAARRASTLGKWKSPAQVSDVNSKHADTRSPFQIQRRFFYATNAVPDEKFKDLKNYDLFERSAGLAPTPLLRVDTAEDEMFPWVTPSGREFYFSRRTKEGWRLFVSKGPYYGGVSDGKLIEELAAGFHHCTLTSDGLTMYLQGPLGKDRWGLFRTTRKKLGGPWAEPTPLTALNSPEGEKGDMSPCLAQGGTMLYFASDRPGGQGGLDLWSIPTAKLKAKRK